MQVAVDSLLNICYPCFLLKMVRSQLTEVVVRVDVIERQNQIDKRLSAAGQDLLR